MAESSWVSLPDIPCWQCKAVDGAFSCCCATCAASWNLIQRQLRTCRSKHSASDSMYDLPNLTKPLLTSAASSRRQSTSDSVAAPTPPQV